VEEAAAAEAPDPAAAELPETGPLRRCIVTGEVRPKQELIRFVAGPDGTVVPDLAGRLPGRGLWLTPRRDIVALAAARRAFARAARAPVTAPDDLAERVEGLLRRRCCDLVGLARRAGLAVAGFEKVRTALREGKAGLVLAAVDGGESGREKVRAGAPDVPELAVLTAAELAAAFGREHVVHVALAPGRLTREIIAEIRRLAAYSAPPTDAAVKEPRRRARRNEVDGSGTT
jgi:predicted RNA-binding protein YlxR (DUF448 family)